MAALPKIRLAWLGITAGLMALTLWMVFLWVPTEINQGNIQRSLYFHVPVAWTAMVAIALVAVASVAYLKTRDEKWDRLAVAGAETGVIFAALMLITGMVWAKPVWGVWWTGEAKLTTTLILFFIYVAYLMFRAYFPPGEQRRRLAAIIGLIGAIDTPIIYYGAQLWERAHPSAVVGRSVDGPVGLTLLVATVAFSVLFVYVAGERYRLRRQEDEVAALRRAISLQPSRSVSSTPSPGTTPESVGGAPAGGA
ncbi:MAG: cytochrome c biogenesis protein CcsA [Dehalococcoidia bacterium]|jgi:heme exporter protein C|nr:cytochrome c biogenesis protein CcsA [Dehalococcoidia bacterium]